jgi:hypothetical protein
MERGVRLGVYPPSCSVQSIGTALLDEEEILMEGPQGAMVIQSFREAKTLPYIKKIVAFECGPMSWFTYRRKPALIHHALVLLLRRVIAERQRMPAESLVTIFQDPIYTEGDITALRQLGPRVVNDPQGFLAIDEETLVVSINPSTPVRQIVADLAKPAMMVWKRVVDAPIPSACVREAGAGGGYLIPYVPSVCFVSEAAVVLTPRSKDQIYRHPASAGWFETTLNCRSRKTNCTFLGSPCTSSERDFGWV